MSEQFRVLVTRRIAPEALAMLREQCAVTHWDSSEPIPRDRLLVDVANAEGLLALLTERVDAELLDAAPQLKIVANMAVGYDNIDVAAATERGVLVTNTPGVLTETSAEFAFVLILAAARRLKEAMRWVERGQWTTWDPLLLLGRDLEGATLGLVGYGRIAAAVARRAHGIGMRLVYHSRNAHAEDEARYAMQRLTFDDLLRTSDVVSLHVPFTTATRHLISHRQLHLMKPTAFLVNTSRGGVLDQQALYTALTTGSIAGAALDVTEPEPLSAEHPLVQLDNCLVVPHIASASVATRTRMATLAAENIIAVLRGEPALTPVRSASG
jgi:lactate dehydrogenase-like 2-hydroxyacid dehydrogenase